MDIGPDDHHTITIGHTSEARTRSSDDSSDSSTQPAVTPGFENAGQQDIQDADIDVRDGLEQLLRDPYCHGMQEIPSAVEERARVLRYLLREQGQRTITAPSDLTSSHSSLDETSNEGTGTPNPTSLNIPDDLEPATTTIDPGSPLFIHFSHGLALTVGSALGSIPPSNGTCLEAFLVPNKAKLTAGARAWSKHSHRSQPSAPAPSLTLVREVPAPESEPSTRPSHLLDSTSGSGLCDDGTTAISGSLEQLTVVDSDSNPRPTTSDPTLPPKQKKQKQKKNKDENNRDNGWWGAPSGPVSTINERVLELFWKVMNGATWRNLHWLPHQVLVYEVRVPEGYGMRWSQDQSPLSPSSGTGDQEGGERGLGRAWIFRGFVEPMMENGHEVGWRHPI